MLLERLTLRSKPHAFKNTPMIRHSRQFSPLPFLPLPPAECSADDSRIPVAKGIAGPAVLQALSALAPSCVNYHCAPRPRSSRLATTVVARHKALADHGTVAIPPRPNFADVVRSLEETGAGGEPALKRAVVDWLQREEAGGNFTMHYQPLYKTQSALLAQSANARRVSHYEALIRHPHYKPQEFIPAVEKWAPVELALLALRITAETARRYKDASFSVNMPGTAFNEPCLPSLVAKIIAEIGVDAERIMIEVTETGLLPDMRRLRSVLYALRQARHQIAIDDYDMGHARRYISALRDGPNGSSLCDAVKIDRECVQLMNLSKYPELQRELNIIDDPNSPLTRAQLSAIDEIEDDAFNALVEFVGDMHQMGVRVIAEGVEYGREERRLESAGVDELQGYFLSVPKLVPSVA